MDHQPFRSALFSFALALALLIPVSAPAITENSLETAPPVTLPEITEETVPPENTAAPIPYLPYDMWIPDRSEEIPESEEYTFPRLTNRELERIRGIMADLEEGRNPGLKDLGFTGKWVADMSPFGEEYANVELYMLIDEEGHGQTFMNGQQTRAFEAFAADTGEKGDGAGLYVAFDNEANEPEAAPYTIVTDANGQTVLTFYAADGTISYVKAE